MSLYSLVYKRQVGRVVGLIAVVFLGCSLRVSAQPTHVKVEVKSNSKAQIHVRQSTSTDSWSFVNAIAGTLGLADRIVNFQGSNRDGDVSLKRIAPGEYRAERPATECSYTVAFNKPEPGNVAHVSWMSASDGLLMLADLLPHQVSASNISIEFVLPQGWTIHSAYPATADGVRLVGDPEKAVFLIGISINKHEKKIGDEKLTLFVSGTWPFSNSKVLEAASGVLKRYEKLFEHRLPQPAAIFVLPMAVRSSVSNWKAETRGSTVVLLIDPTARFATWTGQLGVIFTHELFHLWVPNGLMLQGDYDWFFEGFTLYQGLLAALDLKLINSQEFLNTLSRVLDSYLSYSNNESLIDSSERRWANAASYVYDKGMLVAFMYDLISRREKGVATLPQVYRELFASFDGKPVDGNEVIIRLLSSSNETRVLCEQFVKGRTPLELESFVPPFGFRVETNGGRSVVRISENLTNDQRRIIRSLGLKA